jgi:cellobiose-specific phosphotransferase system component IIC
MTLPKDWDKSKTNTESGRQSVSPRTMRMFKFIIPLIIIFIVWMVLRAAVNSGFDEADRMLAQGCYSTSTDFLGVPKDFVCP